MSLPDEGVDFAISSSQQTWVTLVIAAARASEADLDTILPPGGLAEDRRAGALADFVALFETIEKGNDPLSDFAGASLQREMSCIDESDLCIGKIALERLRPRRQKEGIVSPPHDQRRGPLFPEIALPSRVGGNVGAVIIDEVKLYLVLAGPVQIGGVKFVAIGRQQRDIRSCRVLALRDLRRQRDAAGVAVLLAWVLPVFAE